MFDIRIFNLDTDSYLFMTPEKAIAKEDKEKKDLYLQDCLERRRNFTPMVYSEDVIPRAEALATQIILDALARIRQQPELMYGAVMALFAPWRG